MAPEVGLEPTLNPCKQRAERTKGHKEAHTAGGTGLDDLRKVVAAWSSLPPALKAAINAIVSSHSSGERAADEA